MTPRLLAISPGDGRDLLPWLVAVAPHVDAVVLREPRATPSQMAEWVAALRGGGCTAIRHLRAPDVDADGVHAPDGMAPTGPGLRGVSRHGVAGLDDAFARGADYALLSPVFAPTSKPAGGPLWGVDGFAAAAAGRPVLALGGVDPASARVLVAAGAFGIAVQGGLFLLPSPAAAAVAAQRYRDAVGPTP